MSDVDVFGKDQFIHVFTEPNFFLSGVAGSDRVSDP